MDFLSIKTLEPGIQPIVNNDWENKNIHCLMLRLDELETDVSGNKLFKLYYFLQQAIKENKGILTFGGPWSNHLAATASACKMMNINCIGIVRGEELQVYSNTLQFCADHDMQLKFVSRSVYDDIKMKSSIPHFDAGYIIVPEGGYSEKGAKGAALINQFFSNKSFTHICCSIGTTTTFAGLLTNNQYKYLGFTALKNMTDVDERINHLKDNAEKVIYKIIQDYHFGGFAKYTPELITFMNEFYQSHHIPLDFVYTGKMMFGISDMIANNYFPADSRILCIHTGGLQGNLGLPKNTLMF